MMDEVEEAFKIQVGKVRLVLMIFIIVSIASLFINLSLTISFILGTIAAGISWRLLSS